MKRAGANLLIIIITFSIAMLVASTADAQMRMEYPKRFRFHGLVELTYRIYNVKTSYDSGDRDAETRTFQQYYRLGAEGYIYHPRLAIFNANIHYEDTSFRAKGGYGNESSNLGYDFLTTFLPYRPVSLDIYGRKINYTVDWTGQTVDTSSDLYGFRLRVKSRKLPAIRLEYYHYEYDILRYRDKVDTIKLDRYTLDIRGFWNRFRTRYQCFFDISDYSRPGGNFSVHDYRINTHSILRHSISLSNYLGYLKSDTSKYSSLSSHLDFGHGKRFTHYYGYEYLKSDTTYTGSKDQDIEDKDIESTRESLWGSWSYRIMDRLNASLSLRYGRNKVNDESWKTQGFGSSISYGWLWDGFNFSSYYRFFLREDERRGDSNEHRFEFNMSTSRIRIGTLYMNYIFYRAEDNYKYLGVGSDDFFDDPGSILKYESTTTGNIFRLGIRGRLPGRTMGRSYWNVEGQYYNSTTEGKRPLRTDIFDSFDFDVFSNTERFQEDTTLFSLRGDISYFFRKGITTNLKAGYDTGETKSRDRKRYFYEGRINYPIKRTFFVSALWREIWQQLQGYPDRKESNFEISSRYNRGKVFLTFDGRIRKIDTGNRDRLDRRLELKFSRYI